MEKSILVKKEKLLDAIEKIKGEWIDLEIDLDFYKGQPFIRGSDPTYSQEEIPDEYDIHKAELPLDSEIKELIVEAFEREREEVEA